MNRPSAARETDARDFELESFLPYRLSLLSNTISQGVAQAYRREFGLSITEWRVIAVLGRYPAATASEIVTRTAMDKVSVSRAVKKLEERGLVRRRDHSEDRRRQHLELTPGKGRRLFEQVVPRALAYEAALLESLGPRQVEQLERLVTALQGLADSLNRASD